MCKSTHGHMYVHTFYIKNLYSSRHESFQLLSFAIIKKIYNKYVYAFLIDSVQLSSVAQSCPTLCDPMNRSMPVLLVHHQLPEFTQTHVHRVSNAIQPSHPLSSPSPLAPHPSQHQSLFQWVNSSHEVAEVLEFQLLITNREIWGGDNAQEKVD